MSESNLAYFVALLCNDGLSPGTIKSYLSAARYTQIPLGFGDPNIATMPQLEFIVKGLKKKTAVGQSRSRLPITPEILQALKRIWEAESERSTAVMLWAVACMCFFGFLRSGKIVVPSDREYDPSVRLSYGDVRVDSTVQPQFLEVLLKASKTDPFWKGVMVYLGRTYSDLCQCQLFCPIWFREALRVAHFSGFRMTGFLLEND